jgi:hypothetical protein
VSWTPAGFILKQPEPQTWAGYLGGGWGCGGRLEGSEGDEFLGREVGIPYSIARVKWRAKPLKKDRKEGQREPWGGREVSSKV